MAARHLSLANGLAKNPTGVKKHKRNMKGTCVMKSNAKCFGNESQRWNEKGNPIPADKNQTLTKKSRWNMRK